MMAGQRQARSPKHLSGVLIDDGTLVRAPASPPGVLRNLDTQTDPVDEKLRIAITQTEGELKESLTKVRRMRGMARTLGLTKALAALDHFLKGSGEFVEIPADKVAQVREEAEEDHKKKLVFKIQLDQKSDGANWGRPVGARTVLALEGLSTGDRPLPEEKWPNRVVIQMEFASGVEKSGISDDNLAYYGSAIMSEVRIECSRKQATRCYQLRFIDWTSWVVDNYDWEGNKQFGSDLFNPIRPNQRQMNALAQAGLAKSYQRSSKSWKMDHATASWTECFETDEIVSQDAQLRQLKRQWRSENLDREAKAGALPLPRPAEEILGN